MTRTNRSRATVFRSCGKVPVFFRFLIATEKTTVDTEKAQKAANCPVTATQSD